MSLVKFKSQPVNSIFDDFFNNDFFGGQSLKAHGWNTPAANISESDDGFEIELAAPGYSKKDFEISVEDKVLKVSAEKEEKSGGLFKRREFSYQSFERSFNLTDLVDVEKISAEYKDGILSIRIPKKEEAKVRTRLISVK